VYLIKISQFECYFLTILVHPLNVLLELLLDYFFGLLMYLLYNAANLKAFILLTFFVFSYILFIMQQIQRHPYYSFLTLGIRVIRIG